MLVELLLVSRYSQGEIHFSLMAVISELRKKYERELEQTLAGNLERVNHVEYIGE
jgi:hypothetical protein